MVGLAFWWLGAAHDPADPPGSPLRLKACSHSVGVLPAWQGRGIGLRLKLAQRDAILAQGLTDWMTWTYDPLYRPNAVFNIHRLGATCRTYDRNVYGAMQDALNAGLPSDRCTVDWRLRSPAILQDATRPRPTPGWDPAALIVPPITNAPSGFAQPVDQEIDLDGRPIAVPLPDDIAALRRADPKLWNRRSPGGSTCATPSKTPRRRLCHDRLRTLAAARLALHLAAGGMSFTRHSPRVTHHSPCVTCPRSLRPCRSNELNCAKSCCPTSPPS